MKRKIEETSVLFSYKEHVDKKLKEFETQMEEKRQKVKCKRTSNDLVCFKMSQDTMCTYIFCLDGFIVVLSINAVLC